MIALSLTQAAAAVGGALSGAEATFHGVSTDTRTLNPGELFVALKGERFDGHDSLAQALERGAAAAIVARETSLPIPAIRVADTRLALGRLAHHWRRRHAIPVIGVTGSNGKTSTKEMIASILRQRGDVLATRGNLNNDVGVPLTLFQLAGTHRAAVIEMGANGMRDIADLVTIAEPTVGVVTMCGPAHLAGFGALENVAQAKGEMFRRLGPAGVAVINADDRFCDYWRGISSAGSIVTFGLEQPADYRAENIALGAPGSGSTFELVAPQGRRAVALPLDGRHNIHNALAAAAAALAAGATLAEAGAGLGRVAPVNGRLNVKAGASGSVIIDDTYNANPASLAAALAVLGRCPEQRWLVLGDMGELGPGELAQHRAAGELARQHGVERLFTIGTRARHAGDAFGAGAEHFSTHAALAAALRHDLRAGIAVLVKGSRVMQLDKLIAELTPEVGRC